MTLEAILTEIRDEIKESNRLKQKQSETFKGFSNIAEEVEVPFEETKKQNSNPVDNVAPKADAEENRQAEQVEEAPASEEVDEATFKKAIAKVIKAGTPEQKQFVKEQIKASGASKVSDVPADKRKGIIDAIEAQ